MTRAAGLLAIGVLTVFTAGSGSRGCADLFRSATTLRYPAIRDMRNTVALKPQKWPALPPDSVSVPLEGIERDPGREVMAATLRNPTPAATREASVRRGGARYRIICMQCHGPAMNGSGPVSALFMQAADLLTEPTRQRTDGFIYSYIRFGGVVMPALGAQVTSAQAWDVVNYVRHMQQVSPR
jgi:S-disulfanyl-L-cysteine oxidoreductase SoxD